MSACIKTRLKLLFKNIAIRNKKYYKICNTFLLKNIKQMSTT